jgi:hypothetical protein
MKKYNEEYFSVINKKTGKKLLDCGNEQDALEMVALDPQNRTYTRNKFLMGEVIDVEVPKALPTNEIVVNMDGGVGGSWDVREPEKLPQIGLPQGQGEPVRVWVSSITLMIRQMPSVPIVESLVNLVPM